MVILTYINVSIDIFHLIFCSYLEYLIRVQYGTRIHSEQYIRESDYGDDERGYSLVEGIMIYS